ncbi:hypothetical protein AMTR_s00008p00221460 [Amborella trichopoda]|uniref:Uncharacterized protein n=1 Tax=Amborella trichopoda TaxID=13333 RepID=W1NIQ1_AMBTC|nr:hypothetical protein AMTR_s00008p00221460 [Amborella trichopoda]
MAWQTCIALNGLSKVVIPHYGRVGHATEGGSTQIGSLCFAHSAPATKSHYGRQTKGAFSNSVDKATPGKGAKTKKASKSTKPCTTAEPEVRRKSIRQSKRALSSLDAPPSVQTISSEAHDSSSRPKKRAKKKVFPSLTLPSEVVPPIQEPVIAAPKVVIARPSSFEVPTLVASYEEPQSKPNAPSSETLAPVPHEPAIIAEIPPLVVASFSSLPSSISNTLSNRKASLEENFLRVSLQGLKGCSLSDLEVKIIAVRDCDTALRGVNYEKETCARFKVLFTDLERWRVEGLQRESEV